MALSGEIITAAGPYNQLRLTWTGVQSQANNSTTITAILYWEANRSGVGPVSSGNTRESVISIEGVANTTYVNPTLSAGQSKEINRMTTTVTHNGTTGAKTQWFYSRYNPQVTLSGQYIAEVRCDGSFVLNVISRGIMWIRRSGVWQSGNAWVRVSGSWRQAKDTWVRVGGVWRSSK